MKITGRYNAELCMHPPCYRLECQLTGLKEIISVCLSNVTLNQQDKCSQSVYLSTPHYSWGLETQSNMRSTGFISLQNRTTWQRSNEVYGICFVLRIASYWNCLAIISPSLGPAGA